MREVDLDPVLKDDCVLVIDDEEPIRRFLSQVLCAGGFRTAVAANGREACELLAQQSFAVVLCDLTLPDVEGLELIEYIADCYPNSALLLVTGVDDPTIASRAIDLGAYGYIVKPFEANEIVISVHSAIRRRALELAAGESQAELERQVAIRTEALASALLELEATTEELRRRDERFRSLAECSPTIILLFDRDGQALFANAAARAFAGGDELRLLGENWQDLVHPADRDNVIAWRDGAGATAREEALECRVVTPSGEMRWMKSRVALTRGDDHRVTGAVLVAEDVTDLRSAVQELSRLAHSDHLTGLPNRSVLVERLGHILRSGRSTCTHAVLFVDLDRFKLVNDSHGHVAGDRVLSIVAQRLTGIVSQGCVSRLGGDEFVVLLEDTQSPRQVIRIAERVLAALRAPMTYDGREFAIAAAIGIAFARSGDSECEKVLADADIALHRAKQLGGNGYEIFDSTMRCHLNERLELEIRLRRALVREEFAVHYQPEFGLDGALVGFEALLRWNDGELGEVSPTEFVPIAEESGLILPLGRWALRQACTQAQLWNACRPPDRKILMSVNLSALQLRDPLLLEQIRTALNGSGLDPALLCLEITESVIMGDAAETIPVLESLRSLGVRLAVDDFGTGYSSLSYLSELPLDYLKIDRSFVEGIGTQSRNESIVVAVIQLAHGLGLQVIAEGVESVEQLQWLRGKGCDVVQGFLIGRPGPAPSYDGLVRSIPPAPVIGPRRTVGQGCSRSGSSAAVTR